MAECRSCGASIRWVETLKGKRIPINWEPDRVRGNLRKVQPDERVQARAQVLPEVEAAEARDRGEDLWLAHFATCPNADQHRARP